MQSTRVKQESNDAYTRAREIASDIAQMLARVDVLLLQELGPWDAPLSDADWEKFLKGIVSRNNHDWDACKSGPYAVLARRQDPRGGCGSYATKLFPWLEAPS